jgi:UDP-N-acetylmuramate--alanine ligase
MVSDIASDAPLHTETYGLEGVRYWQATDLALDDSGARFRVNRGGSLAGNLRVTVPARHFVLNALAATAACTHLDVPFAQIADATSRFHGARRRFERVGEAAGILVMDDYAHHPTEVRVTLAAARKAFPERRLIGIHQPHTYSRISYLWDEWTRCWDSLDELIILETYAARETPVAGRSAADLAAAIEQPRAAYAADFEDAARQAIALARPGDVVMTIGAGDVTEIGPRVLEMLR